MKWYEIFKHLCLLFSIFVMATLFSGVAISQGVPNDAVSGAIARHESVFSGRITYTTGSGVGKEIEGQEEFSLTFSGPSWKRQWFRDAATVPHEVSKSANKSVLEPSKLTGTMEETFVSHRGRTFQYKSTPQLDGQISKYLRVASGDLSMDKEFPPCPQFPGTFWYPGTLKFVTENRSRVKSKGVETVGGYRAEVFEWVVSAKDADLAFRGTNRVTRDGGLLRVSIAPSLGYAILRIDKVGVSGQIGAVLEASDFSQANGIHLPSRAKIQYFDENGPSFVIQYHIKKIANINEPIPESEFILELPIGTEVHDARDKKNSNFFTLTKDSPIPEGLNTVVLREGDRRTPWFRSWKGAVAIGVGLGVIGLLVLFVSKRVQARRLAS